MKVLISFEDIKLRDAFPLTVAQTKTVVRFVLGGLSDFPEYEETRALIGVPSEISIHVCGDARIRDLQKRFRGIDRATDVLSFCEREVSEPSSNGYLGEVVLSMETVARHALKYRRSRERETVKVLVHSILHLLGFDHVHVSSKKRFRMQTVEKAIEKSLILLLKL